MNREAESSELLDEIERRYPGKFAPEQKIFCHIRRGNRIFIGTGCGEPQYLVQALINYVESHPTAFYDAEVFHIWTLGVAPYTESKYKVNFRHNAFFIGDNTREAVNSGLADYTPIFLAEVPDLIHRGLVPVDVALIQTSLPDHRGYLNLGVSVDIVKAAIDKASLIIAQVNSKMPQVPGDGLIDTKDVDFIIPYDEPLLEYQPEVDSKVAQQIGKYVSCLVQDGDTIQVGYGSIPNAILSNLVGKKHLGVHTELLSAGMISLMKKGVIDNTKKTIDRGRSVATFCMGTKETYEYIHNNPAIEFRTVDYTNNPLVIARHDNLTAINSALEIDLTGQATAESLGKLFFSGIGGQADFMRGAKLARNGRTILALPATAENGAMSRIVPFLKEGAGVTLNRGDVQYVVTEYGIAYLHGKNIRERTMELVAIAHPKFRPWLIEEAKSQGLIYKDQAFIPGKQGEYPENLETYRTTKSGLEIFLRPVKICDEPLLKDFFYALSDQSLYRRFISTRQDMPHKRLQEFVITDYTADMLILAILKRGEKEEVIGLGQYNVLKDTSHIAEVALAVRDDYHGQGVGTELLSYLVYVAKKSGLLGIMAVVLRENQPMFHLMEKLGDDIEKHRDGSIYELKVMFEKR